MKPYSVDPDTAMEQWEALVAQLKTLGIKVDVIDQKEGVPDMVFAADQGIVRDGAVLLANFRYTQRKPERVHYRTWFRDHGFRLRALSNVFPFEGGDALFFNNMLFVGTGYRASISSCEELAAKLEIDVMPLRLVDPYYYHLDMCFLPINEDTAFYYPPAFSENSQNLLKRLVPNLLELSTSAAKAYASNSLVSGTDIIIPAGTPAAFSAKLKELGLAVHVVDTSEFNKAGGGIRCLINTLE
ncbi:MAG TPA: arginine deiminase family protein [Candidatus Saccharimonadales bacterium]|nr:arginine deiminase family protein [Candidatus Saccharimonadales bacterium]